MTQEEKAKRYDEALERAKLSRLQLLNIGEEATEIEYIFPELKASEDEQIRQALLKAFGSVGSAKWGGLLVKDILDWLEKQNHDGKK